MESHAEAQGHRGEEVPENRADIFRPSVDLPPTLCGSAVLREPLSPHLPFWDEKDTALAIEVTRLLSNHLRIFRPWRAPRPLREESLDPGFHTLLNQN